MSTEEILNILNNPEDKMYWVDDTHVLGFHSSTTSGGFEKSLANGGYFPGETGTTFGKGLYTNLCPLYTTGCFLGEFIQVFEIDIASDLAKNRTLISSPGIYKEVYNEDPKEDFILKQIQNRLASSGGEVTTSLEIASMKVGMKIMKDPNAMGITWDGAVTTGDKVFNYLGNIIMKIGFKNFQYFERSVPDGMSHVSYLPSRFCKHVGTFKLVKGREIRPGVLPKLGVNKFEIYSEGVESQDSVLSSRIEKVILGTSGSITARFKKEFKKDDQQEIIAKLQSIFEDDAYADKWLSKLK